MYCSSDEGKAHGPVQRWWQGWAGGRVGGPWGAVCNAGGQCLDMRWNGASHHPSAGCTGECAHVSQNSSGYVDLNASCLPNSCQILPNSFHRIVPTMSPQDHSQSLPRPIEHHQYSYSYHYKLAQPMGLWAPTEAPAQQARGYDTPKAHQSAVQPCTITCSQTCTDGLSATQPKPHHQLLCCWWSVLRPAGCTLPR